MRDIQVNRKRQRIYQCDRLRACCKKYQFAKEYEKLPRRQPGFTGIRDGSKIASRTERDRERIVKVPKWKPKEKPIQEVDALNGASPKSGTVVKVVLEWWF